MSWPLAGVTRLYYIRVTVFRINGGHLSVVDFGWKNATSGNGYHENGRNRERVNIWRRRCTDFPFPSTHHHRGRETDTSEGINDRFPDEGGGK